MNKETLRMQMLAGIITEGQYKQKLNEGKQVGDIYHFTTIEGLSGILNDGFIYANDEGQVSTTRNKNVQTSIFMGYEGEEGDPKARLKFDGDKISNKYKIRPSLYDEDTPPEERDPAYMIKSEFEEQIVTNGEDFPVFPYLKEVTIFTGGEEIDEEIMSEIEDILNEKNIPYEIQ
jgi:hypothetical protein